jgi:hypothetical protein
MNAKFETKMERTEPATKDRPSGPAVLFWTYVNGAHAGVYMEPGDVVSFTFGGPHEEGFSRTTMTFKHDGEFIVCSDETDSRDCDGPLSTWDESEARIDALDAREPVQDELPRTPAWEIRNRGQRDAFAEAAGY